MRPVPLSLTARSLYAELRELALAIGAAEHLGEMPGSVVRKSVRGREYLYHQYRDLDGRTRQSYLGADQAHTRAVVTSLEQRTRDQQEDVRRLDELRAAFLAAGGTAVEHAPWRVLKGFADAGLLRPGAGVILVGTHAFGVMANLLGVRWAGMGQTQDIDLAGLADIDLALGRPAASAPDALARLEMGFIPVPALDPRSPSTSYRVRGRDMRVDLLTPETGRPGQGAIFVPVLNSMAQPLRFLDFLLAEPVSAVVTSRSGQVLVNIPAPERFALHKLLVSESRPAVFANKAGKDRGQAMQVLSVLLEEAPDGIRPVRDELVSRGKGWRDRLFRALEKCEKAFPDVVAVLAQDR